MATVDKDAIRAYKRDAVDGELNRAERLDAYADGCAEANANLESPPGATGPGWVPPAGGDVDTNIRSAKVQEAVDDVVLAANRRSSGRDDWEKATDVKPARKSSAKKDDDDDAKGDGDVTDRSDKRDDETDEEYDKRKAAEKRAAEAQQTGVGQAATVQGRRGAPKSTT